jgi:hydroxymethylbilane synthase
VSAAADERTIRIATRGSALALAQAGLVAEAVADHGRRHELVIVETEGDRRAPDTAWGEGAFVKSIERALLEGRADIAVHSAKDVPTDEDPALAICAYLRRADAHDALVVAGATVGDGTTLSSLPAGSVIGTDSPRRSGFLRARRPDLVVRPLHGNVDTRLRRLDSGEVDALVVAAAGLVRLGRADRIAQRIPADVVPPAPGQGAIALQVRADDEQLLELGSRLDDRATRLAVEAERAFLRAAGGGCRAPIGALATISASEVRLLGGFATLDGAAAAIDEIRGPADAVEALAQELAARLSARRAEQAHGPRVLLTRPREQNRRLAARLAEHGVRAIEVPAIDIEPAGAGSPLDEELGRLGSYAWAVVTSRNGARAVRDAAARLGSELSVVRWAAIGAATAAELRRAGIRTAWQPAVANSASIGAELPLTTGERVLLVRGSLADEALPALLRTRGADVHEVVAYETREAPPDSRPLLAAALSDGGIDAVTLASPSAVRGLLALAGDERRAALLALPAICIGPTSASAARRAGFTVLATSAEQDADSLAELTIGALRGLPTRRGV